MNPHISEGTTIDQLLAVARDAGAAGGKICGAGGGGYLLLACEPERQAAVREALEGVGVSSRRSRSAPTGSRLGGASV